MLSPLDSGIVRIHLLAQNGPALLVGAILASADHAVSAEQRITGLRLRLPVGWLAASIDAGGAEDADLILCGETAGPVDAARLVGTGRAPFVVLRSGSGGVWGSFDTGRAECAALFDLLEDGSYLELVDEAPTLVVPQGLELRRLQGALKQSGVRLEEARTTSGHVASLLVLRLLDLPVTLCNSTRESFLSTPEGRRIAIALLEEGLRVADKLGLSLSPLGWSDPRELLRELERETPRLEALRHTPGRRYPAALAAIWGGKDPTPFVPQRAFVKRATEAGVAVDWNRRALGALPRIGRTGFLRGPAELLRLIA